MGEKSSAFRTLEKMIVLEDVCQWFLFFFLSRDALCSCFISVELWGWMWHSYHVFILWKFIDFCRLGSKSSYISVACMRIIQGEVFVPVTFLSLIPSCFWFNVACEDEDALCAYFKRTSVMLMLHYEVHIWIVLLGVDFWLWISLVLRTPVIKNEFTGESTSSPSLCLMKVKLKCKRRDHHLLRTTNSSSVLDSWMLEPEIPWRACTPCSSVQRKILSLSEYFSKFR